MGPAANPITNGAFAPKNRKPEFEMDKYLLLLVLVNHKMCYIGHKHTATVAYLLMLDIVWIDTTHKHMLFCRVSSLQLRAQWSLITVI